MQDREEFLKMLLGALGNGSSNKDESNFERVQIRALTASEKDEFICMKLETERICKLSEQFYQDQDVLMARRKLFWHSIRRSLRWEDVPHLEIDDADENICEIIHPDNEKDED